MSIHVADDKKVIVKVPLGTPTFIAENFIKEKKDWITKQMEKVEKQTALADSMGPLSEEDIKQIKKKARVVIPQRVEYYAKLAGVSYNKIFIRLQKTRWGSCSVDGNLNFNCLLMLAPRDVLDSVIVHELCHRLEMNHSPRFWALVARVLPDYEASRAWLRDQGWRLMEHLPQ